MGYTVFRSGGTKDSAYEAYVRLLRQHGVDLGRLPRVPEPGMGHRWLYVWSTEEEARAFADELGERTGDPAWEVLPVAAPPSEGPLGPVLIQLVRQGVGLTFALHPLSRATLQSAFPAAVGVSSIFIDALRWDDFRRTRGRLSDLIREIAPTLTGVGIERLEELGYAVIDYDQEKTLVSVPPAEVAQR